MTITEKRAKNYGSTSVLMKVREKTASKQSGFNRKFPKLISSIPDPTQRQLFDTRYRQIYLAARGIQAWVDIFPMSESAELGASDGADHVIGEVLVALKDEIRRS